MNCCVPTIIPFSDSATQVINYNDAMAAAYGKMPNVEVYHQDGTDYVLATIEIKLVGNPCTSIHIDNGGIATGYVKIF